MNEDYSAAQEEEETGGFGLLNYLPSILWHRRWFVIVPFVLCSLAGLAVALLLPATYRASATLLVESQELPRDLVGSPVTALIDQRIAKIRQQVLSRGDLIELIQKYNLYPDQRRREPLSAIIEKMRQSTNVSAVSADIGPQQGMTNTIAFSMSFDYGEPIPAQLVMQSFVEKFLEIDAAQMAEQAGNTVEFLTEQANSIQHQIAEIEGKITSLKADNGAILARAGVPTISNPGSYDAQIAALQRENVLLAQQARTTSALKDPVVAQAEADLAAVKAVYTDNHPDVRLAERRLDAARRVSQQRETGGTDIASVAIAANNQQIAALGQARSVEEARSSTSIAAQARAPVLMEQIDQLESRADALRSQYREVSGRLLNARSSARMETEQKGERLAVVDPPVVPDKPMSPNRLMLIGGGVAGGLGLGLVLALLIETFLRPVRGVEQIERLLGVPPLVVIPTMRPGARASSAKGGFAGRLRARLRRLLPFRRASQAAE